MFVQQKIKKNQIGSSSFHKNSYQGKLIRIHKWRQKKRRKKDEEKKQV